MVILDEVFLESQRTMQKAASQGNAATIPGSKRQKEKSVFANFAKQKIKATETELLEELDAAMEVLAGSKLQKRTDN